MPTNILLDYHESFVGSPTRRTSRAHGPPAETRLILAVKYRWNELQHRLTSSLGQIRQGSCNLGNEDKVRRILGPAVVPLIEHQQMICLSIIDFFKREFLYELPE